MTRSNSGSERTGPGEDKDQGHATHTTMPAFLWLWADDGASRPDSGLACSFPAVTITGDETSFLKPGVGRAVSSMQSTGPACVRAWVLSQPHPRDGGPSSRASRRQRQCPQALPDASYKPSLLLYASSRRETALGLQKSTVPRTPFSLKRS